MTGERALQIIELALRRTRDKALRTFPQDFAVINAVENIANEIDDLALEAQRARASTVEQAAQPYPDEPAEVTIRRERDEWDKGRS